MLDTNRPWLSQFDKEFYHWEDRQSEYKGIKPDHGNGTWKVDVKLNGRRFNRNFATLTEAQQAINTFRQSAGEGWQWNRW